MKQSPTAEDAKRAITVDELISRLSKLFPSKEERTSTRIIPNFDILEKIRRLRTNFILENVS